MLAHSETERRHVDEPVTRALLVSDVAESDSLRGNLEQSPLQLFYSGLGTQAIAAAVQSRPSVVLVDCRSKESQAVKLCANLRSVSAIASALIIAITPEDRDDLRIRAFDAGVDDCFAEPATGGELYARLDAVQGRLRREAQSELLRYADVELDLVRHKVRRAGTVIWMPRLQLQLLKYFMENPAVVFTRQELLEAVWSDAGVGEGAVTVGVVRLRRALNSTGGPDLIRQVRGIGYSLDADFDQS